MTAHEKHRDFSQLASLLAEHTASTARMAAKPKVTKARQPANDNKPSAEVLAWPALERLAYRGDAIRITGLQRWRYFIFPKETVVVDEEEAQYEPELSIEIRPSEAELLAAVGREVIGRERWEFTGEVVNVYSDGPEPKTEYSTKIVARKSGASYPSLEARIGDLTFCDGELKRWGTTRKGKALSPVDRTRGAKGGDAKPARTETAIWSYIELKGAASPLRAEPYLKPLSTEPAIGDYYTPSPAATEARQILQAFGIDGSVRFEGLPFQATRCPDGLATGALFIGGVKMPKPTASAPAGRDPELMRQAEAMSYAEYLRSKLGRHAKVLDMAITHASSAAEIGIAMGLAPAYAAKRGAALIDEAIDALNNLLETIEGDPNNLVIEETKIAA